MPCTLKTPYSRHHTNPVISQASTTLLHEHSEAIRQKQMYTLSTTAQALVTGATAKQYPYPSPSPALPILGRCLQPRGNCVPSFVSDTVRHRQRACSVGCNCGLGDCVAGEQRHLHWRCCCICGICTAETHVQLQSLDRSGYEMQRSTILLLC